MSSLYKSLQQQELNLPPESSIFQLIRRHQFNDDIFVYSSPRLVPSWQEEMKGIQETTNWRYSLEDLRHSKTPRCCDPLHRNALFTMWVTIVTSKDFKCLTVP